MLLRAALPVGFMPDLDALQDGRLEIVVCTPSGLKTITVPNETGEPTEDNRGSSDGQSSHECPFHAVVAQAAIVSDSLPDADLPNEGTAPAELRAMDLPSAAALGPPVGSRAPPRLIL